MSLSHLGWAADVLGDHSSSTARYEQALTAARAAGDDRVLGITLNNYGVMALMRRDFQRARSLIENALPLLRRAGDGGMLAMAANNLAIVASNGSELEYAEVLINEAIAQAEEVDDRPMTVRSLGTRAEIALMRDNIPGAAADLAEAIKTSSSHHLIGATSLLCAAATIAAEERDPIRAAMLWGAADHARAGSDLDENPAVARLRAHWQPQARAAAPDTESWDAAYVTGTQLTLDEAAALARDTAERARG